MSVLGNLVDSRFASIVRTSQYVLNSRFPDEFELYMCALELVSVKTKKTLSYFVFPVMPSSFDFTKTTVTNIQPTFGGVSVLKTTNFNPFPITLVGTFGRGYRVGVGNSFADISSISASSGILGNIGKIIKEQFDLKLKSGYGYCKILEAIIDEAQQIDADGQRVLYYYNLSFNQKYVVEPSTINFKQDLGSNMVWNYTLALNAVAPLSNVSTFHSDGRDERVISSKLLKEKAIGMLASKVGSIVKNVTLGGKL